MMAHAVSLPAEPSTKRIGLDIWMNRVLELAEEVQHGWKSREVHDLRVALRRCRTMADALSEVNPDRGWRELKKDSRELFQALGALRDTQVEQEWLKNLSAPETQFASSFSACSGIRRAAGQGPAGFRRSFDRKRLAKIVAEASLQRPSFSPLRALCFSGWR